MANSTPEHEVKRNARWTTALIVLFIIQAAFFITLAYQRVAAMANPERLGDLAEEYLEENYQELRQVMKQQITKAAPAIAKELSLEARQSLPEARKQVADFLIVHVDRGLEKGAKFSEQQFREFLETNRDTVQRGLQEVKELPKEAEALVIDLEKAIEKQLGVDIQKQAQNLLALHRAVNKKLERLTSDQSLEPRELLEQRMLRIARTIQLRATRETERVAGRN